MKYGKNTIEELATKLQEDIQNGGMSLSDIMQEISDFILPLEHHKDTTIGLYAMDFNPSDLLYRFWQRSSDACPLECIEAEKQEKEFNEFVKEHFVFQIEF